MTCAVVDGAAAGKRVFRLTRDSCLASLPNTVARMLPFVSALEARHYGAPLAAPFQQVHIRSEALTAGKICRCALFPCCNKRFGSVAVSGKKLRKSNQLCIRMQSDEAFKRWRKAALQKGDRDKGMHRATASPS